MWPKNGPSLSCELAAPEPIEIDAPGLMFSLRCLLENAMEACENDGSVVIRSKTVDDGWTIEVEDSAGTFDASSVSRALTAFAALVSVEPASILFRNFPLVFDSSKPGSEVC